MNDCISKNVKVLLFLYMVKKSVNTCQNTFFFYFATENIPVVSFYQFECKGGIFGIYTFVSEYLSISMNSTS